MRSGKASHMVAGAARRLWKTERTQLRALWAALMPKLAQIHRSPLSLRIGVGVATTLAAVAWRLAISGLGNEKPYVTFYLAVLVASLAGGTASGLASLLLSVLFAHLWLAPIRNLEQILALITFLATNGLIIALGEAFHRTLTRVTNLETQRALERLAAINTRLTEQFGSVAAAAPGVVFSYRIDYDGQASCPFLAENARNVFGLAPELLRFDPTPIFLRVDPADTDRVNASFTSSASSLTLLNEAFRYDHPTKGQIWLEMQAQPVRQQDGSIIWHGYAQDITERKLEEAARRDAERSLEQRILELERANERLARFAYVASHDLQEPLRKVVAFSELLDAALISADKKDIAYASEVMRSSALRARELVDDLLTYSRIVDAPLKLKERDLHDEVQSALSDLSERIKESDAEISIDVPSTPFRCDPPQFARLLHNLVSNAIKFHRPGEKPKLAISARVEDNEIRLTITDYGVGFEAKYAKAIFEPFRRLHSKAEYPGTGIGLAICRTIADRHGWKLTATSQPSQGTTFLIVMPRAE